ncbi:MAG: hypothetical protein CL609_13305 [Anaerolineaceae bacterium]|nr:hypothetical protein [Anaerolineaceae bacterium]
MKQFVLIGFLLILLTGCVVSPTDSVSPTTIVEPTRKQPTVAATDKIPATPTLVLTVESENTILPTVTQKKLPPIEKLNPDDWQSWPVVPNVTDTAKEIYQRGLDLGKQGNAFIKIGDCETYSTWFLADFESDNYILGEENQYLTAVISEFQGSYSRLSVAAKAGFNAASVLSPFWADREVCESNETPLTCEIRLMQPSFALVTLGSNDVWQPEKFEANYRLILDGLIKEGVVPILATKADNVEGDHVINQTIARLAVEYDLPVWNFWLAVKDLPDGGLQDDGVHLTWASNRFDDPLVMQNAWPVRNLTALQVLDAVWSGVNN